MGVDEAAGVAGVDLHGPAYAGAWYTEWHKKIVMGRRTVEELEELVRWRLDLRERESR